MADGVHATTNPDPPRSAQLREACVNAATAAEENRCIGRRVDRFI